MIKKIITSKLFSFFIIFSLISVSIIITLPNATAEPLYFTELNINYSSDGQLNNYTVKLNVSKNTGTNTANMIYTNNHCMNFPFDINFKTITNQNVSFWKESYNSTLVTFWLKLPIINSSGTTKYLMFYGDNVNYTDSGKDCFSELIIYGISEIGDYDINITATYLNTNIYYNYTLIVGEGENMETIILLIWVVLMIVFLLISLKYTEWEILGGIIWLLAGLLEFINLNTALGLIIISIGMLIMLYGILDLMKR